MERLNYESAVKNIRSELKNYVVNSNLKSLVLGVSGGIDSALVAALAYPVCTELNIPLIGRSIPIDTNKQDERDRALLIGKHFCTNFKEVDLTMKFMDLKEIDFIDYIPDVVNEKSYKIRMGNIKARLRMVYLYNLASKNGGLVLSTDNWTEWLLGFWTLHGDVGDYGMIQELWKSEVYDMAEWMVASELFSTNVEQANALNQCIFALATDGLGVTNLGDLGQILPEFKGTSREGYKIVDNVLKDWSRRKAIPENMRHEVESKHGEGPVIKRHTGSNFKRKNPTNIPRNLIIK